jgi:hypothetical protein
MSEHAYHIHAALKAEYWMRVNSDGTETLYPYDPLPLLTLRVHLYEIGSMLVEQTYTLSVEDHPPGTMYEIHPVRPRGEGWVLWDARRDEYSAWRRLARVQQGADYE